MKPGPGGSHMPQNNSAHGPHLLSLCYRARELQALSQHAQGPVLRSKRNHHNEKPEHWKWRAAPAHCN